MKIKSKATHHAIFTKAQLHQVLGHASLEVIAHVVVDDITINRSSPSSTPLTIECETCSTLKAIEIVSRQLEVKD